MFPDKVFAILWLGALAALIGALTFGSFLLTEVVAIGLLVWVLCAEVRLSSEVRRLAEVQKEREHAGLLRQGEVLDVVAIIATHPETAAAYDAFRRSFRSLLTDRQSSGLQWPSIEDALAHAAEKRSSLEDLIARLQEEVRAAPGADR
jgi:hypothetical protein